MHNHQKSNKNNRGNVESNPSTKIVLVAPRLSSNQVTQKNSPKQKNDRQSNDQSSALSISNRGAARAISTADHSARKKMIKKFQMESGKGDSFGDLDDKTQVKISTLLQDKKGEKNTDLKGALNMDDLNRW